ncbi:MAG: carbonic anhydrase [Eubacteriales bacterium]
MPFESPLPQIIIGALCIVVIVLCFLNFTATKTRPLAPKFKTPREVKKYMQEGNQLYLDAKKNVAPVAVDRRKDTTDNGQHPYAVVITCSDSRVPPEHIFSAGIGDLFVIRTAGNVIGDFELGSIEYAVLHLHCKLVLVLGHEGCGAVGAALGGYAEGCIQSIINEVNRGIGSTRSARDAEILNVRHGIDRIYSSAVMHELFQSGEVAVEGAIYHISDGKVSFSV